MIDICLLGSGGVIPLPNRWLTSLLVKFKGKMLLIDCGEGTQIPLAMTKWGFKHLDAILFTHYHADHVAGLPGLLLTIGNAGRVVPLTLIGPVGLAETFEGLTVIAPTLPYAIKLIILPTNYFVEVAFNDICIKSNPIDHTLPGLAYSIEIKRQGKFDAMRAKKHNIPVNLWGVLQNGESITVDDSVITPDMVLGAPRKGIKLCYCTDSRPTDSMVDFIKDADLFICEGMYGDQTDASKAVNKKHMLFTEAAQLAKDGGVKEMWLTHYSPSLKEPELFVEGARDVFARTVVGTDLLCKRICFED
ncbi:MAG: ribonuclease Z [Hyphomonadaceae bacterium]|nr:ribonuclease Z [Clostridia bacterium]